MGIWSWINFGRRPKRLDDPQWCVKVETTEERTERLRNITADELQWHLDNNEPVIVLRERCHKDSE